jgi:hypothetical protein
MATRLAAQSESLAITLRRQLPDGTIVEKPRATLQDLDPICNLAERMLYLAVSFEDVNGGLIFFMLEASGGMKGNVVHARATATDPIVVSRLLYLFEKTTGLVKPQVPETAQPSQASAQPRPVELDRLPQSPNLPQAHRSLPARARNALASFVAGVEANTGYRLLAIAAVLITLGTCVLAVLTYGRP